MSWASCRPSGPWHQTGISGRGADCAKLGADLWSDKLRTSATLNCRYQRDLTYEEHMTALASPEAAGRSAPASFLIGLNLCLIGIYTNFAVQVGSIWVPGIPVVIGALLLLPFLRSSQWLWWLMLFLVMSLVAGGSGMEFFRIRLDSWIQVTVAISCAHVILCSMQFPRAVKKTLFSWLVFIVVGVTLEKFFPPFRELSDTFRRIIFEGRWIYDDPGRDMRDYGFIRPKLFTQEPSHVAKSFVIFGTGWYVLSSFRSRFTLLLVCTAIVTLCLGSPIVLLVIPLAWFVNRVAAGRAVSSIVVAGVPLLGLAAVLLSRLFSARFTGIRNGTDASFFARYQGPYEVAIRTLGEHPIFGVGIGAKEALWKEIYAVYSSIFERSWLYRHYVEILSNAFANSFSFFGIAGALIFYFLIAKWMMDFGVPAKVSLPVVILFLQLDGSLEGLRMWGSIAVILGSYSMAVMHRGESSGAPVPRGPDARRLNGAPTRSQLSVASKIAYPTRPRLQA